MPGCEVTPKVLTLGNGLYALATQTRHCPAHTEPLVSTHSNTEVAALLLLGNLVTAKRTSSVSAERKRQR